jgi:two-component system cell cycle sensor histidine kinase/response regulator CckA
MKKLDTARILIVDDQIHALQGVSRIMRGAGYETFEASNGADCLKMAAEHKPDLILLDVVLPDIDGREVCRLIKSNPETADIYVVLLSSIQVQSDSQAEALERGADGYIARPIPNRELLARVKAVLRLKYAENRLTEALEFNEKILATSSVGIATYGSDGSATFTNEALPHILGGTKEEVLSQNFRFLESWKVSGLLNDAEEVLSSGGEKARVVHVTTTFGTDVWIDCHLRRFKSSNEHHLLLTVNDITERKVAEEAIAETNKRYRLIAETIHDCFWMASPDIGKISYVSPAYEKIWGRSRESLYESPRSFIDSIHPDDRDRVVDVLDKHRSLVTGWTNIYRIIWPDGSIRWVEDSGFPVLDEKGKWYLNIGVATDITERKRAEEELILSEEKFSKAFYLSPDAITITRLDDGMIVSVNDGFKKTLGYEEEDLIGKCSLGIDMWDNPEDRNRWAEKLKNDGKVSNFEACFRTKDRDIRYGLVSAAIITLKGVEHILTIGRDITERKKAEEELRKSETKLRLIAETNEDVFWMCTPDNTKMIYLSPSYEKLWGRTLQSVYDAPLSFMESIYSEDRERVAGLLEEHGDGHRDHEYRIFRPDGTVRWVHDRAFPIRDENGNVQLMTGVARDITDRKKAESSQMLLTTAVEQAAEGVIITDPAGIIQYVNPSQEIVSGYSRDELIGQTINILKSGKHDDDFYNKLWETINAGKVWSGRFINKKKDGTEYHEDTTISPVYDKSGNLTNFVAVKHDVTKQVMLQEQLFQAQKMEAIGTLAGGFAHDFNNKLQVIAGYVDLILFDKDLPETLKQELGIIKQTVDSSAELIEGMMVFSRKTPVNVQAIELNKLVAQIRSMLIRTIPKMIEIDLLLADDLWAIKAAPNQIEQILMNLAVNARDAMPDGGKLTIETNNIVLDEEYCSFDPLVKPGRYVLIEVSDTGTGMNKETASHIFEPFFTTKKEGKGTGLGLAVVYGIVEQHGARIVCDSAPSVGTTFRIYFPAIEEVHEEEYFENKEPPRGQGETILLVDDEPNLVVIVSRQLLSANYRVIKASNGNEALNLYEKHRKEIRLVILDLLMPGMSGKQCLEALRKLDPKVRVLVASGALNSEIEGDLKEIGARGIIAKPFETSQLLEEIRKIIDEE